MNKYIAILLLALPMSVNADAFKYQIIKESQLEKPALFDATVVWIAESIRSANDSVQHKDKEAGTIILNALMDVPSGVFLVPAYPTECKLKIDIKNKKYRMSFTQVKIDFGYDGYFKPIEQVNWKGNEKQVIKTFNALSDGLDEYLVNYKNNDDW